MDMEGLDSNNSTHNSIAKGKRTKRMRLLSPCGVLFDTTTTVTTVTSSTSSASSTTTYESEEEDMANCLILLAQGGESHHPPPPRHDKQQVEHHGLENCVGVIKTEEKGNSNSNNVNATTTATTATAATNNTKVGFYIYECKSCNRTFPSFQALGGHRASHKKPKLAAEEKKQPLPPPPPQPLQSSAPSQLQHMIVTNYDRFEEGNVKSGPPISLQLGNNGNNKNKGKIHECSICGSEFTSGQALGGHMRRHRASTNTNTTVVDTTRYNTVTTTIVNTAQPRNILQLDLNLPAPEDDVREAKFHFATNQVLVGTPALVDCHY